MQTVLATLINIVILNCFLNKIFNNLTNLDENIKKFQDIGSIRENHDTLSEKNQGKIIKILG